MQSVNIVTANLVSLSTGELRGGTGAVLCSAGSGAIDSTLACTDVLYITVLQYRGSQEGRQHLNNTEALL